VVEIGVGPAKSFSLRVSVAALVSVLFDHPQDGRTMLALEHIATLRKIKQGPEILVRAKALGGGVRLTDPPALADMIGGFHYDSELSRREKDFRLLINPSSWENVKNICRAQLNKPQKEILETSPARELKEEFADTLQVQLTPDQYFLKARGITVQDRPAATQNLRAAGFPTVRIYFLYEARMQDPGLIKMMLACSRRYPAGRLRELARQDARQGGKGRANAILILEMDELIEFYGSLPANQHDTPQKFGEYQLDGNVQPIVNAVREGSS